LILLLLLIIALYIILPSFNILPDLLNLLALLFSIKMKSLQVYRGKPDWSVVDLFEDCADKYPDNPAIIIADSFNPYAVTYAQLDQMANRVAAWAKRNDLKKGDIIALYMASSTQFAAIWIGLAKQGVVTALINNSLPGTALLHAVKTALEHQEAGIKKRILIAGFGQCSNSICCSEELKKAFCEEKIECLISGGEISGYRSFDTELSTSSAARPHNQTRKGINSGDTLFFVYTSGTTGLPKASKIHHFRFWMGGCVIRILCKMSSNDRLYCPLPLYHAAGGVMGLSACFQTGATLVLRSKFSASSFAYDITLHQCTAMQYIGEMARYLVTTPATNLDLKCQDTLRVAIGNGMRPDVWVKFQDRYKIKKIIEFYASTEGNTNIFNNTGKVGAIGIVPWFVNFLYPVHLIRCDLETSEVIRGPNGLCLPCRPHEKGQVVGLISPHDPMRHFDGYTDATATSKKVISNVFRYGDKYFLSGDILERDSFGFFYWVDRVGDTFRWKGENISTSQVAEVLSKFSGIVDVNVYGVEIPGCEGKAGMAALTFQKGLQADAINWQEFSEHLDKNLPSYAQPVFVRVQQNISMTSTFKYQKMDL